MRWMESNMSVDPMAKEGMRIRMLYMDDQYGVDEGLEGTIIKIDDLGTLHVRWDDGSRLGVIPKLDKYQLLPSSKDQVDLNFFSEADFKLSSASKNNKMSKKMNLNFKRDLSKTKPRVKDIKVETDKKELTPVQENKVSLKDEVQTILNTIKTAKPIHRKSLDNMVNNLVNKYKNVEKNEEKFNLLIEKLRTKINDKFGLEETTTASSAGAYNAPLFGRKNTIKKESKNIKVGELVDEATSIKSMKRAQEEGYDSTFWAANKKDDWKRKKELTWKGGKIVDFLDEFNIEWDEPNLPQSNKELNEEKNKKEKEEIEETTTFSSVFNGNFPVTPFMFAKKGKHLPSKKTLWPGGKIIQKVDKSDLIGESLLDEINKIKWVKGGKFVKIKDRCAKYNNKSWCSQGALDNPLELSDTVFENIKKISKKTGLTEEHIYHKIMDYFNR